MIDKIIRKILKKTIIYYIINNTIIYIIKIKKKKIKEMQNM